MWNFRFSILASLIGLSLTLYVVFCTASVPRPFQTMASPAARLRQVGEYVFSHECVTLAPNRDFEVHVPLKDDGNLDTSRIETTGNVIITPIKPRPPGCNVRLNVRQVEEQ